jgi:tetratricopeptide (TPR) repeat protein
MGRAVRSNIDTVIPDAEAHYRAGDYAASAALLAPLAEENPPPPSALRILGLCRLRLGTPAEALDLLTRAFSLAPNDPWARLHYAIGLQATGRDAEAVPLFRACQTLLPDDPAPSLNLSRSLLALGDVSGAINAARKGRLRGGAMPEGHYTLGIAYLAGGFLDRAVESFDTATKLAPRFADAWINLGVAHYRNGNIDAAREAMRVALRIDPANTAASTNLATFVRLTGDVAAGEAILQRVIDTHPHAVAARINMAANLLHEDRAGEALELLAGALPASVQASQQWRLQQALALIKLGRLADARNLLAAIGTVQPSLVPILQWRHALLAVAEGDREQAVQQANAIAATLQSTSSMMPEHRIMAHYDLAKLWSQLGDPDQAFPHWAQGHKELKRFQPFSRDVYAAFVDATIEAFDARRFAQGPRAGNQEQAPVFIVGMPRSGTTLVEQILDAHAQVFGAGERHALGDLVVQLGGAVETVASVKRIAALDNSTLDASAERYLADLRALDPTATRIVDKMPGNFRHLGLMALLFPGARVIACDRDPRDIGLSIFTYRFYGVHAYANDLSDLGWYIGQQRRLMAHWRSVLPNPIMTLRLQDLVHDFKGTLRTLLDFLGLPYDANCERFHESQRRVRTASRTQVREKINARGLGRWRPYEHHLAPMIAALRDSGALDDAETETQEHDR